MQRAFSALLAVLVSVAGCATYAVAQTTTAQVQQKASAAEKDATKAVDTASTQTQAAIAHPETHKQTIVIAAAVLLIVLILLFAALRRRPKKTIIRTRRG